MTLSVVLWIVGLFVAYTVGVFSNLTSPAIGNWIARWNERSLANRIALLEGRLAEVEASPPITEVEEHILWGITSVKIAILNGSNFLLFVAYYCVKAVTTDPNKFHEVVAVLTIVFIGNMILILRLRYAHDFRYKHSPRRRDGLRKAIADLRAIQRS